uniref:TRAF-type domain-containing protein n=1 Tax=Parascaris equorum TaxID=6256 RepID=A0A914RDJ4_PAREQ
MQYIKISSPYKFQYIKEFMEYEECSLDIDDHIHCRYCYKIGCNYSKCKMIICTECSIPLHPCKLDDHLLLCSKVDFF